MSKLNWLLERQREQWFDVVNELANGRKTSNWCWFFMPNVPGLGKSDMSKAAAVTPAEFAEYMADQEYAGYISAVILLVDRAVRNDPEMSIRNVIGCDVGVLKWTSFMTLVRALYSRGVLTFSPKLNEIIERSRMYGVCEYTDKAVSMAGYWEDGKFILPQQHTVEDTFIQLNRMTQNRPY